MMASGGVIQQLAFSLGNLLAPLLMLFAPKLVPGITPQYWRVIYIIPLILDTIMFIGFVFFFNFRTPKFLLLNKAPK